MVRSIYFIYGLFKHAFSKSLSHGRLSEEGNGKDMEGSTCDLF